MKTEKKLKRGLAELSHLFVPVKQPVTIQPVTVSLEIASPVLTPVVLIPESNTQGVPALICASFIRLSPQFQTGDFVALLEQTQPVFSETCLLTVAPSESHLREFQGLFSLSESQTQAGELHDVGKRMSFGRLEEAEIRELIRPHPSLTNGHALTASRKALVILDPPLAYRPGQPLELADDCVLEALDHCVFVVEADLKQLTQAYQLIRLCFARNPMVRVSLFFVGSETQEMCDLVYDRFSMMVSRFLGCDLGFLGWADEKDMFLNPELLLEEGGNPIRFSSKARLSEALFSPVSA